MISSRLAFLVNVKTLKQSDVAEILTVACNHELHVLKIILFVCQELRLKIHYTKVTF